MVYFVIIIFLAAFKSHAAATTLVDNSSMGRTLLKAPEVKSTEKPISKLPASTVTPDNSSTAMAFSKAPAPKPTERPISKLPAPTAAPTPKPIVTLPAANKAAWSNVDLNPYQPDTELYTITNFEQTNKKKIIGSTSKDFYQMLILLLKSHVLKNPFELPPPDLIHILSAIFELSLVIDEETFNNIFDLKQKTEIETLQNRLNCLLFFTFFKISNQKNKLIKLDDLDVVSETLKKVREMIPDDYLKLLMDEKTFMSLVKTFSQVMILQTHYDFLSEFTTDFQRRYLRPSALMIASPLVRSLWWKRYKESVESNKSKIPPWLPDYNKIYTFRSDQPGATTAEHTIAVKNNNILPIKARDGGDLHYYMLVPEEFYKDPKNPRPVVVQVYGGGIPLEFSTGNSLSIPRVLASFGCIVISLRGEALPKHNDDQGGTELRVNHTNYPTKLFEDIEDVLKTLAKTTANGGLFTSPYIKTGKTKIFIVGSSFGGNVTTRMATTPPFNTMFDGYIAHNGVYDYAKFVREGPFFKALEETYTNYDFTHRTNKVPADTNTYFFSGNYLLDPEVNKSISSLYHVDQLARDLLLLTGLADTRVTPQAIDFFNAVEADEKVRKEQLFHMHWFRDSGHFLSPDIQQKQGFFEAILKFIMDVVDAEVLEKLKKQSSELRDVLSRVIHQKRLSRAERLITAEHPIFYILEDRLIQILAEDSLIQPKSSIEDTRRYELAMDIVQRVKENRGTKPTHIVPSIIWKEYIVKHPKYVDFVEFLAPKTAQERFSNLKREIARTEDQGDRDTKKTLQEELSELIEFHKRNIVIEISLGAKGTAIPKLIALVQKFLEEYPQAPRKALRKHSLPTIASTTSVPPAA